MNRASLPINKTRRYRRIPELSRPTTFRSRLLLALLRWLLYLLLIPGILSGVIVGASLELGSTWSEAFRNVSLVAEATSETYQTQAHLLTLSTEILLSLDREESVNDLDLIVYVAEVRSKTSELSASVDRTLANYLKAQVKKNKEKAARESAGHQVISTPPVTLSSLLYASLLGMIAPILLYWLLSYFITRRWLDLRAHETVEMYLSQQESPQEDDERDD